VCPVNIVAEKRLGFRTTGAAHAVGAKLIAPQIRLREEFRPRPDIGSSPELIPLLSLTEEQFRERFRHSTIRRAKRRGLLRNVCVALGNSGDRQAVHAIIDELKVTEPLIRGHTAWAVRLKGRDEG